LAAIQASTQSGHVCRADALLLCPDEVARKDIVGVMNCLRQKLSQGAAIARTCKFELKSCPAFQCAPDIERFCVKRDATVTQYDRNAIASCLKDHANELSARCVYAITKHSQTDPLYLAENSVRSAQETAEIADDLKENENLRMSVVEKDVIEVDGDIQNSKKAPAVPDSTPAPVEEAMRKFKSPQPNKAEKAEKPEAVAPKVAEPTITPIRPASTDSVIRTLPVSERFEDQPQQKSTFSAMIFSNRQTMLILSCVVGGIAFLASVIGIYCFCCRRSRKENASILQFSAPRLAQTRPGRPQPHQSHPSAVFDE
jgi:hypothetical protein